MPFTAQPMTMVYELRGRSVPRGSWSVPMRLMQVGT
jgi:hypothetical protein